MLFAFGATSESFYVSNGSKNDWKGMPNTLVPILNKEHLFRTISFGEDGAYFYRLMAAEDSNWEYCVSAATAINYPKVKSTRDSDEEINWVAFGPGGAYVMDTPTNLIRSESDMIRYRAGTSSIVPLRCASFGSEGVWVVVENDGEVRSKGLAKSVLEALSKKEVRRIDLSPFSATYFFIEYTDGTTDWCLPSEWHRRVANIEKLSIQMDEPTDSKTDLTQNIIFAFGSLSGVYCMSHQGRTVGNCLDNLASCITEQGTPSTVSMGEDGALFWRAGTECSISLETEMAYPEVWKIWKRDEVINWVAFGPEGYYIVDTQKRIYASRQGEMLRTYKESGNQVPIRCASFGRGGSWVIVEDDGIVRSHGLEPRVREALLMGSVRHVALSWMCSDHFYIEYTDQATNWSLPKSWHPKVYEVEGNLPTPTSIVERLEKLPHGELDFNRILYQFNMTWRDTGKKCPTIKYIYKIVLLDSIWNQYKKYLDKVQHEQPLFHGTCRSCNLGDSGDNTKLCYIRGCSLCAILRTSYSVSNARSTGKFGIGIYASLTSSKAAHYAKNLSESSCKAMILNKVAVGNPWFTDKAEGTREAPKGYDSVCCKPGDPSEYQHDETVVYTPEAIRPQYLIIYSTS